MKHEDVMTERNRTFSLLIALAISTPVLLHGAGPEFIVGACTHFSQGKGYLPGNLKLIQEANITSIRDEVGWRALERAKGKFEMPAEYDKFINETLDRGVGVLLALDYGNRLYDNGDKPRSDEAIEAFTRYAEFVVGRYKGKVKTYEIWNEWDISIGGTTPGSAEDYVRLLKHVYPRMKAIDPSITVFGGAMTPGGIRNGWLERMLKAGALTSLDAVSIHTYNYSDSGRRRTPEAWGEWMIDVQELIKKYSGGKDLDLYVTEMGWPTQVDRRGSPPEISAAYLARMYLLSRTMPFMKGIWWYDYQDDGWNAGYNEDNFGILRPDLTPKPAYYAMAGVADLVGRAQFLGRQDTGDPDIWVLKFRRPDGKDVWAMWSTHADDGWQVVVAKPGSPSGMVAIQEVGRPSYERPWGTRDWPKARQTAEVVPNEVSVVVREMPWLITGDLGDAAVKRVERREFPETQRMLQVLR